MAILTLTSFQVVALCPYLAPRLLVDSQGRDGDVGTRMLLTPGQTILVLSRLAHHSLPKLYSLVVFSSNI